MKPSKDKRECEHTDKPFECDFDGCPNFRHNKPAAKEEVLMDSVGGFDHAPPAASDWESEFEDEFGYMNAGGFIDMSEQYASIKQFIRENFIPRSVGKPGAKWEEDFDEKWGLHQDRGGFVNWKHPKAEAIKQFIRDLLQKEREAYRSVIRERIESLKWKLTNHSHLPPAAHHEAAIRNTALSDVEKAIEIAGDNEKEK